jgi:hypothetical protein
MSIARTFCEIVYAINAALLSKGAWIILPRGGLSPHEYLQNGKTSDLHIESLYLA